MSKEDPAITRPLPRKVVKKTNVKPKSSKRIPVRVDLDELFAACALPASAQELVREQLTNGEHVIWLGQPDIPTLTKRATPGGLIAAASCGMAMLLIGAIYFLATFSLLWTMVIFGVLGLLGSAFAFWLTLHLHRKKAQGTVYLLTDQRAVVIARDLFGKTSIESFYPFELRRLQLVKDLNASGGDLVFRTRTTSAMQGGADARSSMCNGFLALFEPEKVQDLINQTLLNDDR